MATLKTELLTLCDYAMTSQQGKLSIIGLFDRIFVTQVPSKYSRFFAVAILSGEAGKTYEVSLSLVSSSGESVLPKRSVKVTFGGNGRANLLTDIANLTLKDIGEYKLQVSAADKLVGEASFYVTKAVPKKKSDIKN